MELQIADPTHVSLPSWLARTPLSLEEIGGLFVLCCIEKEGLEKMIPRLQTEELIEVKNSLSSKGIFTMSLEGSHLTLDVDLTAIQPADTIKTAEGE